MDVDTVTPEAGSAAPATDRQKKTRLMLVHAARDLVIERRHDKISVQEITQRARVGTGTFYNYFESKQEVFAAVIEDFRDGFKARFESQRSKISDPAMRVATTLRYYFQEAENPDWKQFIACAGFVDTPVLHQAPDECRQDIAQGVHGGRFKVDDIDFTQKLITGMVRHTSTCIQNGEMDVSAIDQATRSVLRMLGLPDLITRALTQSPLPPVSAPRREPPATIRAIT